MAAPTMFAERSQRARIILVVVVPAAIGGLAGLLLGVSAAAYWVVALLAAVGGLAAGFEHSEVRAGAARGLAGGFVYGVALLLVHEIAGTAEKVSLGSFPPALAVITALVGAALSAVGALIARRRAGSASAPPGDR